MTTGLFSLLSRTEVIDDVDAALRSDRVTDSLGACAKEVNLLSHWLVPVGKDILAGRVRASVPRVPGKGRPRDRIEHQWSRARATSCSQLRSQAGIRE